MQAKVTTEDNLSSAEGELVDTLRAAESFISDELETRQSSFLPNATEDENGYIASAQRVLGQVRAAIAKAAAAKAEDRR